MWKKGFGTFTAIISILGAYMNRKVIVFSLLCLIWGSTWLFIKLGLQDLPPISFAGIRFFIATLVLLSIIRIRKIPLPKKRQDWLLIVWTGFLSFTVNYGLVFWGEQRTSSGLPAILQATIPLFALFFAHYYLPNERFTWRNVSGVLLGIAGVAVIFSNQITGEVSAVFAGSIAIVIGSFCVAYSNILIKARARNINPVVLSGGQMACGFIPLLIFGWASEGSPFGFHWTGQAIVSLLYLTFIGSCVAFLLFYWLLKQIEATKAMLLSLVTPVIAVLLGLWWLHEEVTWNIIVGAGCIMLGITLNIYRSVRAPKAVLQTEAAE